VTPEGLLSVLALPFLQHLDYFTTSPVPKSFVWGIAGQNPSLESISVHTTNDDGGEPDNWDWPWSAEEKAAFFKEHPRIKTLDNLVSILCNYVIISLCHF